MEPSRRETPTGSPIAMAARASVVPVALATGILLALLFAARRYEEVQSYLLTVAIGTTVFVLVTALCLNRPSWVTGAVAGLGRMPVVAIAAGFGILAALGGHFVLGDIPHVSDEVAYQFQARTLATGGLFLPPPPVPEAFNFLHIMIYQGKWYGIMNPGWPAFLAIGELIGTPWIINPLLGALALLVFHQFFKEAGLERSESQWTILLMALSPFLLFMSGSYMSHPVNLLLLGIFCWAWVRMLNGKSMMAAAVAGLALAINLIARPVDSAVVTLPFLAQLLWHIRKTPRLIVHAAIVAVVGSAGIAGNLVYNQQLTGNPLEMPVTRYFDDRNPGEKFGIGFGAEMGTKLHGDEWPGFTPVDGIRVTAYRLVEFLKDLYGIPLIALAAIIAGIRRPWREWGEWRMVIIAGGLAVIGVYFLHFYHGIAYGSRHYYLAVPAFALILGRLIARGLAARPFQHNLASASVIGLLVTLVTFTMPSLVREYTGNYRGVSPAVATAVRRADLGRSLIFVETGSWSWKSAFPLNRYPLDRATMVFARDRGPANEEVIANFPGRKIYYLAVGPGSQVTIKPAQQQNLR